MSESPTNTDVPFEELMTRLESVVEELESGELSLEAAMTAYQRGVELARLGHDRLDSAERKLEELVKGGTTRSVEPNDVLDDPD